MKRFWHTRKTWAARLQRLLRPAMRFVHHTKGASALEFAIVGPIFLALVFSVLEMGYIYAINSELDALLDRAIAVLQTGTVQLGNIGKPAFLTTYICPNIPVGLMSCSNLALTVVNSPVNSSTDSNGVTTVTYGSVSAIQAALVAVQNNPDPSVGSWYPGTGADYVGILLSYPVPIWGALWSTTGTATYQGQQVRVFFSQAMFANQPIFKVQRAC